VSGGRGRVLIIEDKANMLNLLRQILAASYDVETAADGLAGLAMLERQSFDVVLSDVRMPGANGIEVVRTVKQRWPGTEVILMTAFASIEMAVQAMREGAYDYLPKPFDPDDVTLVVARALERKGLALRTKDLPAEAARAHRFSRLVGESPAMKGLFDFLARAATLDVPVLLTGEAGSGKELAAESIHSSSARAGGPFLPVDCGALPAEVLQEELLEDAGIGAPRAVPNGGLWQKAAGGTLFLNEIDRLPANVQIALGRLVEKNTVKAVDVRLLAGCIPDVATVLKTGALRQELFCHIAVMSHALPPLRERGGDIPLLAQHFLSRFAKAHRPLVEGFHPEVITALLSYEWPGNVRELRNVIERAVTAVQGTMVTLSDLPFDIRQGSEPGAEGELASMTYREALVRARDRASQEYLTALMRAHSGRVTQAAAAARIERESLHRLLKRYNVKAESFREPGALDEDPN
jgi:DNA-binding NtrC family response regulator